MLKYSCINILGLSLLAVGWIFGLLDPVIKADTYHLCKAIAVVFLVGNSICFWKILTIEGPATSSFDVEKLRLTHEIRIVGIFADRLVLLGLIGTVIGFVVALSGINESTVGEVSAIQGMVAHLLVGMKTALYSTLTGAVLYIWLSACYRVLTHKAVRFLTDG